MTLTPHKCPVCDGTGKTSRPPWVPGDREGWVTTDVKTYPCVACAGNGILYSTEEIAQNVLSGSAPPASTDGLKLLSDEVTYLREEVARLRQQLEIEKGWLEKYRNEYIRAHGRDPTKSKGEAK